MAVTNFILWLQTLFCGYELYFVTTYTEPSQSRRQFDSHGLGKIVGLVAFSRSLRHLMPLVGMGVATGVTYLSLRECAEVV